jgi:hypothetical protein
MKNYIQLFEEFISGDLHSSDSMNENLGRSQTDIEPKLNQASEIIKSFLNKKTGKAFVLFPFIGYDDHNTPVVMLFSDKDLSCVKIYGGGRRGIIGTLEYLSKPNSGVADFSVSSENFPIVSLLSEFVRLINDPSYAKSIDKLVESSLYEARKPLSPDEQSEIQSRLEQGESAADISKSMGISYGMILQVRKGVTSTTEKIPAVKRNEMLLEDKVKLLDETLEDIYEITRRLAAGGFNSLFISGRAGTGKTFSVERALKDEGLVEDEDYIIVSGAVSVIMMYKKMFQYRNKVLVFDDCDSVFRDETGRNILKAALDTKKVRRISYLKKSSIVFDPKDYENDPEAEWNAVEGGMIPAYFEFAGRVVFISNLPKDKADPDGAIRSRSILVDVNPDDVTLMERIRLLLPHMEPRDMSIEDKLEVYEFMKRAKDVSMRTFVKAAGFKSLGMKNWARMAERYL